MTQTLIINEELKNLLPPLSDEEFAGLEKDILEHGCLCDIVVWEGILIDGHHRYEICKKHQIPYGIKNVILEDIEAAKYWAWNNQDKRRNLTPYQRAEIAFRLKPAVAAQAKERQRGGQGGILLPQLVAEAKETRRELAEIAQMSHTTFDRAEYVADHADEETKTKLRRGEKGVTITGEYNRLKAEKKAASTDPASEPVEESEEGEFYPEPPCPNKDVKYFPKTTLKLIPQESPRVLLVNLFEIFREGFVEEMVLMAFDMLLEEKGKSVVKKLLSKLNKKHGGQ